MKKNTQVCQRYKRVIKLREIKKKSFSEIAEILKVSKTRAWQLYALAKARESCKER